MVRLTKNVEISGQINQTQKGQHVPKPGINISTPKESASGSRSTGPINNKSLNQDGSTDVKNIESSAQINQSQKNQPVPKTAVNISTPKGSSSRSTCDSLENQGKPPLSSTSPSNQKPTSRTDPPPKKALSMGEIRRNESVSIVGEIQDFQSPDNVEITEEQAKHLARVMNSLRHMELHTGASLSLTHRDSLGGLCKTNKPDFPSNSTSYSISLAVRPSTAGAVVKFRGRVHEVKDDSAIPSLNKSDKGNQELASKQDKALMNQIKTNVSDPLPKEVSGPAKGFRPISVASSLIDKAEIENFTRRESLAVSEYMEDDTIQWKKGNILGKGAFGTVWCGLTNEGELIAVKQIELTTMDQIKAQREYEKIQEEVELLKTLEHINIVGYLGTSLEDNVVSIFMQFIPGGSLASVLARFGALDESVFQRYTKQILEGVNYLHDNDVIHRDLKGANVMLMPTGVIKLIDFGCAKRLCMNLNLSKTEILKSMKETPYWMAPEVVNETGHGKKSDIWSIGCTVFEMATRKPPWADMNRMVAIFAIGSAERPVPNLCDGFSIEAIEFFDQCLTRDQENRPSALDLLNHPFITMTSERKVSKVNNDNSKEAKERKEREAKERREREKREGEKDERKANESKDKDEAQKGISLTKGSLQEERMAKQQSTQRVNKKETNAASESRNPQEEMAVRDSERLRDVGQERRGRDPKNKGSNEIEGTDSLAKARSLCSKRRDPREEQDNQSIHPSQRHKAEQTNKSVKSNKR